MKPIPFLRHPLVLQLLRFGVTGTLAAIVHFAVVILLVQLAELHPLRANIIGFLSAFMVSFTGHRYWTFSKTKRQNQTSLPLFFSIAAFNLVLNQSLFYLFLKLHIVYPIALLMVLCIVAIWTFAITKLWIFRE